MSSRERQNDRTTKNETNHKCYRRQMLYMKFFTPHHYNCVWNTYYETETLSSYTRWLSFLVRLWLWAGMEIKWRQGLQTRFSGGKTWRRLGPAFFLLGMQSVNMNTEYQPICACKQVPRFTWFCKFPWTSGFGTRISLHMKIKVCLPFVITFFISLLNLSLNNDKIWPEWLQIINGAHRGQ